MKDWAPAGDLMPQFFQNTAGAPPPPPLPSGGEAPNTAGQNYHEINYEIMGGDMQIVEVELDPCETVIAEAGAMNYLEEEITFEAKMGDGMAFIHAGGHVIKKELKDETLRVDTGCLVGFSPSIDYNIERAGNLKSIFFGGEGLFLATLRGRGTVYLQSLPFSRMADRIIGAGGASGKVEGSVLGGHGNLLDGEC